MVLNDLVIRVKNRSHRGDITITNDTITQQIIDAINDARREVIRDIPKQWLRTTTTFNTVPATSSGGATAGTLTSAATPSTSVGGTNPAQMGVSLNGEAAQNISLATTLATGADIANAIQAAVQLLVPVSTYNATAYSGFTCTFTNNLYVCTNGQLGSQSTIVITSVTGAGQTDIATTTKLTVAAGGVAVSGTGALPRNPLPVPLYDLPADCQEPVLFRYSFNGADYFLSKVESEREFYINVFGTTVSPNKPLFFFDAGVNQTTNRRQVYIWPIADIIYTIFFTYQMDPTLTDFTTANLTTAIPVFPSYVQDMLWKGAYYHFLKQFDDPAVGAAKADYEEAKMAVAQADERDLDSDLQFRMDVGRRITDFRSPGTGIRLK